MLYKFNSMCMSCTYQRYDKKVQAMRQISEILDRLNLPDPKIVKRFNWGNIDTCKIGIKTCNKINSNKKEFQQYIKRLDPQLSAFMDNPKQNAYHEILWYLHGNFPQVYVQFEQTVRPRLEDY